MAQAKHHIHPLKGWLSHAGETVETFALRLALEVEVLQAIIEWDHIPEMTVIRRIIAETDGWLDLNDFLNHRSQSHDIDENTHSAVTQITDFTAKKGSTEAAALEQTALQHILFFVFNKLQKDTEITRDMGIFEIAAESINNTYAALYRITSRQGQSRLSQALLPAIEEILQETPAYQDQSAPPGSQAAQLADQVAHYYEQYQHLAKRQ